MIKSILEFINKEIGISPFLFTTAYAAKAIGFALWPREPVAYLALIIVTIDLFRRAERFNSLFLSFVIYLPISTLLDKPNTIFSPWLRLGLFLLLVVCVSPLVNSDYARQFRRGVFKMTMIYCVIISVLSFFCYFFGINMMQNSVSNENFGYLINKSGTFSGITPHSMLLAPMAGMATLVCTYFALKGNMRKMWICLAIACCGSLLFTASRSSLIATIVGEMSLFWYYSKQRGKAVRYLVTILIIGAISFPLWENAMEGITAKNHGNIIEGIDTNSRWSKWDTRLEEFGDSPITGIGFASVSYRDIVGGNGIIEPGSSWLAVLSMTGIIGFIIFGLIYYIAIKRSLFTNTPLGALLGGILVLLGVHMIAEGHIFSAGSFLCFCVWLFIGVCTDYPLWSDEGEDNEIESSTNNEDLPY